MAAPTCAPSARRSTSAPARAAGALAAASLAVLALAGCAGGAAPAETSTPVVSTAPAASATASASPEPSPTADASADAPAPTAPEAGAPTPTPDATSGKDGVTVAVTAVEARPDGVQARAFIQGFIGEGTCTATLTAADGRALTASVEALPDAQTTVCPPMTVTGATSGSWQLVVRFESADRAGESAPETVEIP